MWITSFATIYICLHQYTIKAQEDDVIILEEEPVKYQPYKFFVVIERDHVADFIDDVINASVSQMSDLISLHHIILQQDATIQTICSELGEGGHLLYSLVKDEGLQSVVRRISAITHIPTIQIDYSVWNYEQISVPVFNSSQNWTTDETAALLEDVPSHSQSKSFSERFYKIVNGQPVYETGRKGEEADGDVGDLANYVRVVQPTTVLLNIVLELRANKLNMTRSLNVLYDDTFDDVDLQWQDVVGMSDFDTRFEPLEYQNESAIRRQMDNIKARKPTVQNILILANIDNVAKYFAVDMRPFDCRLCTDVKVTSLQPEEGINFNLIRGFKNYIRDYQPDKEELVNGQRELETSFYHDMVHFIWQFLQEVNETMDPDLAFGCNLNQSMWQVNTSHTLTNFFDSMPEGGFGPYLKDTVQSNMYFQNVMIRIVDIKYTYLDYNQIQSKKIVGNWTVISGIQSPYEYINGDFNGVDHYTVVTIVQPPFVERCDPFPCSNGLEFEGYSIDVFENLREMYHFTYDIYEVKDKQTGYLNDNDEWNGIIADLLTGKAEIAVAPMTQTAERQESVEFTVPYANLVGINILMKKDEVETNIFKFVTVLEAEVWMAIICSYLFSSICLYVFERLSPYSYTNNQDIYGNQHPKFDLKECFWFSLTSMTPQGGGEPPKNISGRIIAATWWLFGFVVIASYTANLAALLTASRLTNPVKSLEDLTQQYKIQYAPVQSTIAATYFRRMAEFEKNILENWKNLSMTSTDDKTKKRTIRGLEDFPVSDTYQSMWDQMQRVGLPKTTREAIDRVLASPSASEGFAFIGDSAIIQYAALTDCRLQEVGEELSRKPYAFAVQTGSRMQDLLSRGILKLSNEQILEALRLKWWNNNPKGAACVNTINQQEAIGLENVGGVFIIVVIGTCLASLVLSIEGWFLAQRRMKKTIANGLKLAIRNDANRNSPNQSSQPIAPPSFLFNLAAIAKRQSEDDLMRGKVHDNGVDNGKVARLMEARMRNGANGIVKIRALDNGDNTFDLLD